MLQRNDANGFVIDLSRTAPRAASPALHRRQPYASYFDAVFNLKVIREGMQQAARRWRRPVARRALSAHDGAGQLALRALDTASTGAGTLASGLGELEQWRGEVADGAHQASPALSNSPTPSTRCCPWPRTACGASSSRSAARLLRLTAWRLRSPVRPAPSPAASPTPRPAWTRSSRPTRNLRPILPGPVA